MALKGPITKDTSSLVLGLFQIRVVDSSDNIGNQALVSSSSDSIGALANTTFRGNTEWYKHETSFPLIEDFTTPIREAAALECAFEEMTPQNFALAYGKDITDAPESAFTAHSGELSLGARTTPDYIRMEARYTYPNGTNFLDIIFPRAQVSADVEAAFVSDTSAAVTIMFESKVASSDVTGGDAIWDDEPLGVIRWT